MKHTQDYEQLRQRLSQVMSSRKQKMLTIMLQRNIGITKHYKFNAVMIIMMAILLLITLVSIALSVITFNRLASEQSKVQNQLGNTNNYIRSALVSQFDTIEMNLSQRVVKLVTGQSNISQNLNQLDTKLEISIPGPLLLQYLRLSVQIHCGPGLWHRLVYLNMSDPSQRCPSA